MKEFNKKYDYKKIQENITNLRSNIDLKPMVGAKYNLVTSPISIAGDLNL